jgi:hypothetical protein
VLHGGYPSTRVRDCEEETWLMLKDRDDEANAGNRLDG